MPLCDHITTCLNNPGNPNSKHFGIRFVTSTTPRRAHLVVRAPHVDAKFTIVDGMNPGEYEVHHSETGTSGPATKTSATYVTYNSSTDVITLTVTVSGHVFQITGQQSGNDFDAACTAVRVV